MSEAFFQWVQAGPVAPGVDFALPPAAPPVPAPDPVELAHSGALHVDGTTEEVAHHLGELASEAAQQAADAAVQVLGTLSGALLAGRAALATTKVLAGAAVRAAEEQRCLERQEKISADAAEQWRNAAFAAARANARRTVLRARIARSAARPAPGDPPPRPDLPGPLDPTAGRLADFRCELARFERRLAAAEKVQADWEAETFLATQAGAAGGDRDGRGGPGGRGPDGPDWQDAVRARRDAMVRDRPAAEEAPSRCPIRRARSARRVPPARRTGPPCATRAPTSWPPSTPRPTPTWAGWPRRRSSTHWPTPAARNVPAATCVRHGPSWPTPTAGRGSCAARRNRRRCSSTS
ncbi:hypothetical protein Q3A86_18995 [Streptomyces sp. NBUA17]|uniref:hypothetical protein n=1 Tax=Streptomyces sp. NBUA17 TaxID=3062275 RepID=UPI0037D9945F